MTHGILHGIARNAVHGSKLRGALTLGSSMVGVTKDATSSIYCPATAAEWTQMLAAAGIASGGPSFLWLMSAVASPVPDVIGTVSLGTGGTAGTFAVAQPGWSRVGWTIADSAAGRLTSSVAALPDPASTSVLTIDYIALLSTPVAFPRQVSGCTGSAVAIRAGVAAGSIAQLQDGGNTTAGSTVLDTGVHPWVTRYNFTGSTVRLFTDHDKIAPTFTVGGGKFRSIGEANGTSANMWCGYSVEFVGTAAEMTDAQIKTLLTTLGWTVTWS